MTLLIENKLLKTLLLLAVGCILTEFFITNHELNVIKNTELQTIDSVGQAAFEAGRVEELCNKYKKEDPDKYQKSECEQYSDYDTWFKTHVVEGSDK